MNKEDIIQANIQWLRSIDMNNDKDVRRAAIEIIGNSLIPVSHYSEVKEARK